MAIRPHKPLMRRCRRAIGNQTPQATAVETLRLTSACKNETGLRQRCNGPRLRGDRVQGCTTAALCTLSASLPRPAGHVRKAGGGGGGCSSPPTLPLPPHTVGGVRVGMTLCGGVGL